MIEVVDDTILESCRTVARAAGMTQGYIDAIAFERTGFLKGDVLNDFSETNNDAIGSEVPLADFFEDGTTTHFHEPRTEDGTLAWEEDGQTKFSKGHWIRGIRAMKIMENGFNFGLPIFIEKLTQRINRFLQENSIA